MTTRIEDRTAASSRKPGPPRRPATARRPAARVARLIGLDLAALRAYRRELLTEESRVSYWRRILQSRLDTALGARGERAAMTSLQPVLAKQQESSRRLANLDVYDASSLPPLPNLEVLWAVGADPSVDASTDDGLLARLADAEKELSTYRRSLHERIAEATSELIARYRDEPALALCALPLTQASVTD